MKKIQNVTLIVAIGLRRWPAGANPLKKLRGRLNYPITPTEGNLKVLMNDSTFV